MRTRQLQFKLDPALARNFGKEGIAAVERAKGRLVDAAIEGQDAGQAISDSQSRSRYFAEELQRLDKRLAEPSLSKGEREELRSRADRLRAQQAREQDVRNQSEEMLANTPMTFNYVGKKGFTLGDDPLGDAWSTSRSSFTTMITMILIGLGAVLPWALLLALAVFLWRKSRLRKLNLRRKEAAPAEWVPAAPPTEPAPSGP